ncbi:hypothetical protein ANCCAN_07469 [Ancylostoma caninum]|uniref:Uncharacterized protein n=1 Tax=Ancylostoma caninum TaxID=29170 RepID=A0A368GQ35_ANCCA|nr:hypothetical protein ANCCAN_07469 [Ancylostoma caninum]
MIRSKLYRALQKALRDVRAYQYEEDSTAKIFRWIPNDRKAKKHHVKGSEQGANEEEFVDVEGTPTSEVDDERGFFLLRFKIRNY